MSNAFRLSDLIGEEVDIDEQKWYGFLYDHKGNSFGIESYDTYQEAQAAQGCRHASGEIVIILSAAQLNLSRAAMEDDSNQIAFEELGRRAFLSNPIAKRFFTNLLQK